MKCMHSRKWERWFKKVNLIIIFFLLINIIGWKETCKEFRLDRSLGTSSTLIFGSPVVPWVCFRYLIATTRIYVCQDYLWLAVTLLLRHSNCPKFHLLCARENSFKLFPYGSKLAIKTQVTKTTPFQSFTPQLLTACPNKRVCNKAKCVCQCNFRDDVLLSSICSRYHSYNL